MQLLFEIKGCRRASLTLRISRMREKAQMTDRSTSAVQQQQQRKGKIWPTAAAAAAAAAAAERCQQSKDDLLGCATHAHCNKNPTGINPGALPYQAACELHAHTLQL
jgi:hypothetical protein